MNTAAIVEEIAQKHDLKWRGKLFAGPCPFCGGSKTSDKFNIRKDGGYLCRSCGETGDVITWLRKQENLTCAEAHARAGKECRQASTCQAADKCRFGAKNGGTPAPKQKYVPPGKQPVQPYHGEQKSTRTVPVIADPEYPCAAWKGWFQPFVEKCHASLLQNTEALAYLAGRGINLDAVKRFSLGWVAHQYNVKKSAIGLAVNDGEKETVWIPDGWLIPIFLYVLLHRIRIRRTEDARAKFLPNRKYEFIRGSGNLPMVIYPSCQSPRGAVVVEADLDALAVAAAHDDVLVISVGTLTGGVGRDLHDLLSGLPVILVALDAEKKAVPVIDAWKTTFNHAKYWPTPGAKDVGEFFKSGGDVWAWVEAGLPPQKAANAPRKTSVHDAALSPVRSHNGGKGESTLGDMDYVPVTLSNGKVIFLVDGKNEAWERLTRERKPVFSQHELERLKEVTAGMSPDERIAAAMAAIETKEVFGGYLSRWNVEFDVSPGVNE